MGKAKEAAVQRVRAIRKGVSFLKGDLEFIDENACGIGLSAYLRLLIGQERKRQKKETMNAER